MLGNLNEKVTRSQEESGRRSEEVKRRQKEEGTGKGKGSRSRTEGLSS